MDSWQRDKKTYHCSTGSCITAKHGGGRYIVVPTLLIKASNSHNKFYRKSINNRQWSCWQSNTVLLCTFWVQMTRPITIFKISYNCLLIRYTAEISKPHKPPKPTKSLRSHQPHQPSNWCHQVGMMDEKALGFITIWPDHVS